MSGADPNSSRGEDPRRAYEGSETQLDETYAVPIEYQVAMEPPATLAAWDGDQLTVRDSTQWVAGIRRGLAIAFGVPEERVRVVSRHVGGGFGSKAFLWGHTILAAAREVGRPVRLALTRQQTFYSCGSRPACVQRVCLGADRDGRLTAVLHDSVSHTSALEQAGFPYGRLTRAAYACPNVAITHRLVGLNTNTPTAMRAPGEVPGSFALESAMDELAYALDLDPIELRLRNTRTATRTRTSPGRASR